MTSKKQNNQLENIIKLLIYYSLILKYLLTNFSDIIKLFETTFSKCWKIFKEQFYCDAENLYLYFNSYFLYIFFLYDLSYVFFCLNSPYLILIKFNLPAKMIFLKWIVLTFNILLFESTKILLSVFNHLSTNQEIC